MSRKQQPAEASLERQGQILDAALRCFARKGFYQTTMHDISDEAGISVGLIYRYFANKDAVISAMGQEHQKEIQHIVAKARKAGSLAESLEIFLTTQCSQSPDSDIAPVFVMDLFAEAGRNPGIASIVREVRDAFIGELTKLIAQSPEATQLPVGITPRRVAELALAVHDGLLMQTVPDTQVATEAEREKKTRGILRSFLRLLFPEQLAPSKSTSPRKPVANKKKTKKS